MRLNLIIKRSLIKMEKNQDFNNFNIMSFLESKKYSGSKILPKKRNHDHLTIEYETNLSKDFLNSDSQTSLISVKHEYNSNSNSTCETELKQESQQIPETTIAEGDKLKFQEHHNKGFNKDNRKNFDYIYEKIKLMRNANDAPVDLVGSALNPDLNADKDTQNFQLLVSLILSVQNRDQSTADAMKAFKEHGLTVDKVYKMTIQEVENVIKKVNFYKNKAKYIQTAATTIKEKYNGKIPGNKETVMNFPGVGNKIANLYMFYAENKVEGIAVDTHVHRICNRIGWTSTVHPDKTMEELHRWVDKEYWSKINELLVGFGQQICLPINPKCGQCLINHICPTGKINIMSGKTKKAKITQIKKEEIESIKEEPANITESKTTKKKTVVKKKSSSLIKNENNKSENNENSRIENFSVKKEDEEIINIKEDPDNIKSDSKIKN